MKYRLEILLKSQIITDHSYKVMTQTNIEITIAVLAASLLTGIFATSQMVYADDSSETEINIKESNHKSSKNIENKPRHKYRHGKSSKKYKTNAHQRHRHPAHQDQSHHIAHLRPQGHPNANLLRALGNVVSSNTVDSDHRQKQSNAGKRA